MSTLNSESFVRLFVHVSIWQCIKIYNRLDEFRSVYGFCRLLFYRPFVVVLRSRFWKEQTPAFHCSSILDSFYHRALLLSLFSSLSFPLFGQINHLAIVIHIHSECIICDCDAKAESTFTQNDNMHGLHVIDSVYRFSIELFHSRMQWCNSFSMCFRIKV